MRHYASSKFGSQSRLIAALGYSLLLAAIFAKPLWDLMAYAIGTSLHSHIVLVPLITAYLIWIRRPQLPEVGAPSFGFGFFLGVIGLAALIARWSGLAAVLSKNDGLGLVAFSFVCLLAAGGFVFLGRRWMTATAFPVAFLLFLIPLPDGVADWLETASKYASAEASALLFGLLGTPVFRNGLFFRLPGIVIEVAQECSGIRSSWVLLITSLLASNLFLRSNWKRAFLVAFVIPLGILRNGFRIVVIGILCMNYGPHMIDSIIHRRGGPVFFALSLIPLFALLWWLRASEARAAQLDEKSRTADSPAA